MQQALLLLEKDNIDALLDGEAAMAAAGEPTDEQMVFDGATSLTEEDIVQDPESLISVDDFELMHQPPEGYDVLQEQNDMTQQYRYVSASAWRAMTQAERQAYLFDA